MKKQFLLLSFLLFTFSVFSQISFDEGYFIDNNNRKVSCFIKNVDWKNNPNKFEYKLSENSEAQNATIEDVKVFEIYEGSKYIRDTVLIDKSLNHSVDKLDDKRNPTFEEEVLFLKVLIEGKASLYSYEQEKLKKYFYNVDDSKIQQLIYKRFIAKQLRVGTNEYYKQQLINDLKCSSINKSRVLRLKYRKKELMNFFIEYNACHGQDIINYEVKQKRNIFNLSIRPGLNISSFSLNGDVFDLKDFHLDNKIGFRFGIEAEYILPFNKNKWGIAIEPTFQRFKADQTREQLNVAGDLLTATLKYSSIEIPASVRHYFYLSNNSKLFINASVLLDFSMESSSLELTRADESVYYSFNVEARKPSYAFGAGYKHQNKYSLELRYQTGRNILGSHHFTWDSNYSSLSFILGYSLL